MFFSFRKIIQENLPDYSWLAAIVGPVNKGFEDVQRVLGKNITFGDNMSAAVITVVLDGVYPAYSAWTLAAKPVGAWVTFCREVQGDHTNFASAVFLDWEWTGERIKINAVPGITPTPTAKYSLSFIAITG